MTTESERIAACERKLLETYSTYDQHVDVVSAFEWIFTDVKVKGLPDTVDHFERFPKIQVSKRVTLTPDFTVLFRDGTAIVGEIAKIAIHENSVEKLCRQLMNYDSLPAIPGAGGKLVEPKVLDVVQVVSMRVGLAAVQRIINDRFMNAEHSFKPSRRPVIVQYARESETYMFQRIPHVDNGGLHSGDRKPNVGDYLDNGLNIKAAHFVKVKAARALINDQADRLYLATHLWAKTWPSIYGAGQSEIMIDPAETADVLKSQHGVGRVQDVRNALELLESAGLAAQAVDGKWLVSRKILGHVGRREVHAIIARRACTPDIPRTVTVRKPTRQDKTVQGTLF